MGQMTARPAVERVISVDIGNTMTKVAVVDCSGGRCAAVKSFPTGALTRELLPAVGALAEGNTPLPPVVIAAVIDHAAAAGERILRDSGFNVQRFTASTAVPLVIRYARPATLGVDRIANALFALTAVPGQPAIIISAGTALVIDLLADGIFYGGAILPGIRLQLESLHRGTGVLPQVDLSPDAAVPSLPAMSTEECITGGVVRGCAAVVEKLLAVYSERYSADVRPIVIATGGDWPLLAELIAGPEIRHVPEATLIGIARALPFLGTS